METISVPLGSRSYPIWIESGLLEKFPQLIDPMNSGNRWVIVTQESIQRYYGSNLLSRLKDEGFNADLITIPTGESAKSIQEFEQLQRKLLQIGCDRKTILLAMGGGVVGDVTGFTASTFMRGIDYIQIPTTLLGMVDSSIGGKTGINLPEGKNLIGTFHQPKVVAIDPNLINTLPKREIASAMGEMLKYGAIEDNTLFEFLNNNTKSILENQYSESMDEAIIRSAKIKADIVARDEMEGDIRKFLNFGHTIGHALESVLGYGSIRHGEAVSYGMIAAGFISVEKSGLHIDEYEKLKTGIKKLPLPKLPKLNGKQIVDTMKRDKKVQNGKINFVLLEKIGSPIIVNDVDFELIEKSLEEL